MPWQFSPNQSRSASDWKFSEATIAPQSVRTACASSAWGVTLAAGFFSLLLQGWSATMATIAARPRARAMGFRTRRGELVAGKGDRPLFFHLGGTRLPDHHNHCKER